MSFAFRGPFRPTSARDVVNCEIATSVASSALTVAIKTEAGGDPSANDPVQISFGSSTASSGAYAVRSVTAALSVVVSSGSTLGHASAVASPIFVYAIDNAGTVELAVSSKLFDETVLQSTTAEGGAGAADSATVLYSTTARSNVRIRLLGVLSSTQTTAGTWAAVPTQASVQYPWKPATALVSGYMTNEAQTFAGVKTFNSGVVVDDEAGQSTLNYYREADHSSTFTWDVSGNTTGSVTLKVSRIGRIVTVLLPAATVNTGGTTSTTLTSNTALPTWARPAAEISFCANVNNAGAEIVGFININSSGVVVVRRVANATFGSGVSGSNGVNSMTYSI